MQLAGTQSNLTVINNLAYFTTTQTGYEAFVWMPTASGFSGRNVIANNTFDENSAGSGQSCVCAMIEWESSGGPQTGFLVENNLFLNSSHEIYYNNDPNATFASKAAISNDGFQNIQTKVAHDNDGGKDYSTLASWQAAGFDINGFNGSLGLTSSYVPQTGSAAITVGANLTSMGITPLDVDKNGTPRLTSWVAGAYQAGSAGAPAPPSDVTAIVQ
jgi:hypothetical protein